MTSGPFALDAATDAYLSGGGRPRTAWARRTAQLIAYLVGAAAVIALTDGVRPSALGQWWVSATVFQHLVVWTLLWQLLGLDRGTRAGEVAALPPVAGLSYWLTPGTMRLPPWPALIAPTRGTQRSVVDVALYVLAIAVATAPLIFGGPLPIAGAGAIIGLLAVLALRDRTPLTVTRPAVLLLLLVATLLPAPYVLIAIKLALAGLGWTAVAVAASRHLPFAFAAAVTEVPVARVRRRLWQRDSHDVIPSDGIRAAAYSLVALGAVVAPVLLFARGGPLTVLGLVAATVLLFAAALVCRLELIALVAYAVAFAFGHGASAGFGGVPVGADAGCALAMAGLVVLAVRSPRFTPWLNSWRAACGSGPASVWLLRRDAIDRFVVPEVGPDEHLRDLARLGLRPNGRALDGLTRRAVLEPDEYVVRSCGFVAGAALGSAADDGAGLHRDLLAALQARCHFAPGQLIVIAVEARVAMRTDHRYRITDAAAGLVEAGTIDADDMVDRVPWRDPARPAIPVDVEISASGTTGYAAPAVFGFFATPNEPDAGWTPVPRRRPRPAQATASRPLPNSAKLR